MFNNLKFELLSDKVREAHIKLDGINCLVIETKDVSNSKQWELRPYFGNRENPQFQPHYFESWSDTYPTVNDKAEVSILLEELTNNEDYYVSSDNY